MFKSDLLFKDGQLTVNGNLIPLFKPAAMPEEAEEEEEPETSEDEESTE